MFRDLIALSDRFRVIAPDLPVSANPTFRLATFSYSFARLAEVIEHFTG
jgi:hypothetical protein